MPAMQTQKYTVTLNVYIYVCLCLYICVCMYKIVKNLVPDARLLTNTINKLLPRMAF